MRCPLCSHITARRFLPLFIVTGPSGAGKTALVPELQHLLPHWDVFETDLLWDSAGDWNMVKCNWLRIADALHQQGRPVVLCGTFQPSDVESCSTYRFFSGVHWAGLVSEPEVLAQRLQVRPAWRNVDETYIAEHQKYARWLVEHADTEFDPPLFVVDTTREEVARTASRVAAWATPLWEQARRTTHV